MSPMRLRDSIRVPVRYGENELDTPSQTSLCRGGGESSDEDYVESGGSSRPRPRKKRKQNTVPYDPTLPPAAFPSLERPHPGPAPKTPGARPSVHSSLTSNQASGMGTQSLPIRGAGPGHADSFGPSQLESVPMDQLENYLASNNMDNPVYARNVELACNAPLNPDDREGRLDSDDDELPDATQVLMEKIPNPAWNDLNPAMQVEIYENMMADYNHYALHRVLGIGKPEYEKLMEYIGIRNKQILLENSHLEQMRATQRSTLMKIDNSDLKMFDPPPQLVLRKIIRETTKGMINRYTNLMMCQSHDFLKARQYLHNRKLPRRYAGNWGDSLVVLKESEENDPGPDVFEWEKELRFTPPPPPPDPAEAEAIQRNLEFVNSFGRGAVDPADLEKKGSQQDVSQDWGKYFEKGKDGLSWDTTRPRAGGMVNLHLGRRNAANIQQYEMTGIMPRGDTPRSTLHQGYVSQAAVPAGHAPQFVRPQITMPPVAVVGGSMAQFAMPQGGMPQVTLPQFVVPSGPVPPGSFVRAMMPPAVYPPGVYPPSFVPLHGQVSASTLPLPRPREYPAEARLGAMPSGSPSSGHGGIISSMVPSSFAQQPARPISRRLHTDRPPKVGPGHYAYSQARYQRHIARAQFEHMEALRNMQIEQQSDALATDPASRIDAEIPPPVAPAQQPTEEAGEPQSTDVFSWEEHEKAMCAESLGELMEELTETGSPTDEYEWSE